MGLGKKEKTTLIKEAFNRNPDNFSSQSFRNYRLISKVNQKYS